MTFQFSVDDTSDIKLWYAIGRYPGSTDVITWTDMRGASILVPAPYLPGGVTLYFTVKARNSQEKESTATCVPYTDGTGSVPGTFDTTLPEGRVDADYR